MIQIDGKPADRSGEPARIRPAPALPPHPRTPTSMADDEHPSGRPSLFVVPPPQPVWPRVFPGL